MEIHLVHSLPSVRVYSYLDDRIILANSLRELNLALALTETVDRAFGCLLNPKKCVWGRTGARKTQLLGRVARLPYAKVFRYMGRDVCVSNGMQRILGATFQSRKTAFLQ